MFALAVEQQLVVDIGQQKLNTPALNTQLVLHQHNGTAVVAGLWTWDHTNLITEGEDRDKGLGTVFAILIRSWDTTSQSRLVILNAFLCSIVLL